MRKILLMFVASIGLTIGGCSSTKDEIDAAIAVCEGNGGLEKYMVNHSVRCSNGAKFDNPLGTIRGTAKQGRQP